MVGLANIPVVGVAIRRISEAIVDAATRGLRYSLCYKTVVHQLNSEIENVKIQEGLLSRKVGEAKNNGKIIEKHVEKWQEEVQSMKILADNISAQTTSFTCFKVVPLPNLISRFRLGRKAAHLSQKVAAHTASGRDLVDNEVGYLEEFENMPTSNTTYQSFASREKAYGKLWEALIDENGDAILGIYGMPGVGKTQMMEQACRDAKDKKIFNKVVRVHVSQTYTVITLQDKLAASLTCKLQSNDNEQQRAFQLERSLMNGGKTLVILDDVWKAISLKNVGIPFGDGISKGCKILLTSRKKDVCLRNNCKDPIELKTLTNGEAWQMFKNTVGSSAIEALKDALLAEKVCKKCAGLPLLIHAVGNALMCATENLWKEALTQLGKSKFEDIYEVDGQVYACVKLSFDMLEDTEIKKCLLLCSFFPEDADIPIKVLFDFVTGSQLLDRGSNIYAVIDVLKFSSLLFHDEDEDTVKLHDVIRDVARSIAAKDPKYAFLSVICSLGMPDNVEYLTPRFLQLEMEEDNVCIPDNLVYPDLLNLWLQGNTGRKQLLSNFFQGFINLKFLLIGGMSFNGHQSCIHRLEKLRVLILVDCDIEETCLSSISENLKTLCIWGCDLPSVLELGKLKNLRKLELIGCSEICIEEKGISGLSSLEELKIVGEYRVGGDGVKESTSIFTQLNQLTHFRNLMIKLDSSHPCPYVDIVNKLDGFNIYVGCEYDDCGDGLRHSTKNSIRVKWNDIENTGWMAVVERAEVVELDTVMGLANGFSISNTRREAFANLTELVIRRCEEMEHVARWDRRNQQLSSTSFCKLTSVDISDCGGMKYLFSAVVAKCLHQMQKLEVSHCSALEEIIRVGEEGRTDQGDIIIFPRLKQLILKYLPSLTNIYTDKVAISSSLVVGSEIESEIWRGDHSFSQLKLLKVEYCDKLEYVIPVTHDESCKTLQEIYIWYCESLKRVFQHSSTSNLVVISNPRITFSALKKIDMWNLPSLESLWSTCYDRHSTTRVNPNPPESYFIPQVTFPVMEKMEIGWVGSWSLKEIQLGRDDSPSKLRTLHLDFNVEEEVRLPSLWLHHLQNIETLQLRKCWWSSAGDSVFNATPTFFLQRLRQFYISDCGVITNLFTRSSLMFLQQLQEVRVDSCPVLEEILWGGDEPDHATTNDHTITISLPRLQKLYLTNLPMLKKCGLLACNMPALEYVRVDNCGFSTLFTSSTSTSLQKLSSLKVSDCPLLESIVEDEMHDQTPNKTISLLRLTTIKLKYLSMLKSFSSSSNSAFIFPASKYVEVVDCPCIEDTSTLFGVRLPEVNIDSGSSSGKEIFRSQ